MNKIDLARFNSDHIKSQLANSDVKLEEFEGHTPLVEISAKEGTNIDKLLCKICEFAQKLSIETSFDCRAEGTILESMIVKKYG